jgi:Uma2 family endonuclease
MMNRAIQDVALPARLRPSARMTDEELMAFSEANRPCKVERLASGEILVMTPGGYRNNHREAYVVHELFAWAEADGRGEAFSSNAGFNLADGSTLSPDAGWVALDRLRALSESQQERYLPFAPDFVVEILSRSDSPAELDAKMMQWMANGAKLGWRIDPFERTLAVYAPGKKPVILEQPEVVEGTAPIAGFRLEMKRLW